MRESPDSRSGAHRRATEAVPQYPWVQLWTMPVMVRLARRQLSRNAPEFGHECRPHEHTMRPFGFSLTVHGWSPCFPQKGHTPRLLSWPIAARTVAQRAARAQRRGAVGRWRREAAGRVAYR